MRKTIPLLLAMLPILASAGDGGRLSRAEAAVLLKEAEESFHAANELSRKDPRKAYELCRMASARYENVLSASPFRNGRIYYNLGNIYFRMNDLAQRLPDRGGTGHLGKAILNYRRSLDYDPNDPKLLQNLQAARMQRQDAFRVPTRTRILKTVFFWHYDFTPGARRTAFLAAFLLFWIQATLLLRTAPAWLRSTCALAAALALLLAASCLVTWLDRRRQNPGVVLAQETIARKGDGDSYEPSFTKPLHAGTEFVLLERRNGWSEIRLPDGQHGWLRNRDFQLVR